MVNFTEYRTLCNLFLPYLKKGRGGVYLGGYEILSADTFGHQQIVDSRHFKSLKTVLAPSAVETSVLALICHLMKPGMVFADVGAGCGYYSLIASSLVKSSGKVYSFEMIPECFKLLEQNIVLNDLDNVHCVNRCISDGQRKETHDYFGANYEFFFLNLAENKKRSVEVETLSLDQFFAQKENMVDFVKINRESHLPAIFKGMRDTILANPEIKILAQFNREKILASGYDMNVFFEEISSHNFDVFLLPTLESLNEHDLLSFEVTKHILIASSAFDKSN